MDYAYGGGSLSLSSPQKQRNRPGSCFSHCFGGGEAAALDSAGDRCPSSPLSPMQCPSPRPLSKAHDCTPELKRIKHRGLIHRVGKHHRPAAGFFRYDPLSYALNFDEGLHLDGDGEISPVEFQYRSFSSRLPSTPPQPSAAAAVEGDARNYSSWL